MITGYAQHFSDLCILITIQVQGNNGASVSLSCRIALCKLTAFSFCMLLCGTNGEIDSIDSL
ncbi:MAG: hypothetical protein WDO19_02440 [Bacteroidota bacterium]